MTTGSVIHDTFTIERTYPATPARVFAAFASHEARSNWAGIGGTEKAGGDATVGGFDFRVGGREHSCYRYMGTTYRIYRRYFDIVPNQRIIFSYEMYADDGRMSVSIATIEFAKSGDGTMLSWTEQGAFLGSVDRPHAPMPRAIVFIDG